MPKPKTEEITPLQQEALDIIRDYANDKGYPPTVKELGDIIGISNSSIYDRINQLVRKGYLQRQKGSARGLTVIKKVEEMMVGLSPVPLVGTVAAGTPILAEENITDTIMVESSTVGSSQCFALNVQGDSMIEAGINNDDLIIVRRQPIAENGDIVVAMLEGEATVKTLRIRDAEIELVPQNKKLSPIPVGPEDELTILGKVIGWQQKDKYKQ